MSDINAIKMKIVNEHAIPGICNKNDIKGFRQLFLFHLVGYNFGFYQLSWHFGITVDEMADLTAAYIRDVKEFHEKWDREQIDKWRETHKSGELLPKELKIEYMSGEIDQNLEEDLEAAMSTLGFKICGFGHDSMTDTRHLTFRKPNAPNTHRRI